MISQVEPPPRGPLPVIHGLWIGATLSRLELLTLRSFVRHGHAFYLWLYDSLDTPAPPGVTLRDANEILPRSRIFRKRDLDAESGVGQGSVSPFSDLFRYKLLHDCGGVWVDMDVTCLRPIDFTDPYLFRAHRLGMVGNVMKCPQGSELMRACYEQCEPIADENVDWLGLVRVLNDNVRRLGLSRFIRDDISNRDSYDAMRPFLESRTVIPTDWHVIHWMSEFLRTVAGNDGYYKGRKLDGRVPDKDNPPQDSTLGELYREYGLLPRARARNPRSAFTRPLTAAEPAAELNILIPALVRGGAERIVVETLTALGDRADFNANLFVMGAASKDYDLPAYPNVRVRIFDGKWSRATFQCIGDAVLRSPTPLLFTHLISARHLADLWEQGVSTVPVVHNASPGWLDPATNYNHPLAPFVIAVAECVARQLREAGCVRPITTVRHELQRWFDGTEMVDARRRVRTAHGIRDGVLLIGMVGQFKSQKAYTRAVRVLAGVLRHRRARLMILGDWDHAYGSGRATYEATCRLALELGVVADLITPGNVHPVDDYFAAFDVFLNTSVYEGLSIALLEAAQAGCPIVAANAGGNREALQEGGRLIEDPSDTDAYVRAILELAFTARHDPPLPPESPDLVPRLWYLMAKYGTPANDERRSGRLIVAPDLAAGLRALTGLHGQAARREATALCVLGDATEQSRVPRGVRVFRIKNGADLLQQADAILGRLDGLQLGTIYFAFVGASLKRVVVKLLLTRDIKVVDISGGCDPAEDLSRLERRLAITQSAYSGRVTMIPGPPN